MANKDRGSNTPYTEVSGATYQQAADINQNNALPLDQVSAAWCPGDQRKFSSDVAPEPAQIQCGYKGSFPDNFKYSSAFAGKDQG